jgi:hypothetical protein
MVVAVTRTMVVDVARATVVAVTCVVVAVTRVVVAVTRTMVVAVN